eukprot:TRINITY_DN2828_c0_g1_i6.p2 TRINITY_DN2828_c0_g1~~TRINITY_DN2828_c0_g1_i6.p2  ORF type:complete len:166 (-),score=22.46 TRINITY_DN2828_c0_g1_i6:88-585(-)
MMLTRVSQQIKVGFNTQKRSIFQSRCFSCRDDNNNHSVILKVRSNENSFEFNKSLLLSLAGIIVGGVSVGPAVASQLQDHGITQQLYDLAQEQEFWSNVVRYIRFFFTVMLGTGVVILRPFQQLLKNPVTAVLLVTVVVLSVIGLKFTLSAMLGVDQTVDLQPML